MNIIKLTHVVAACCLTLFVGACSEPNANNEARPAKVENTATQTKLSSVLIFSKTEGWRHDSIPVAVETISQLIKDQGLTPVATEDASIFNDAELKKMAAVVFVNTTGDILNEYQQLSMERYIQAGGGFVGVHAATDTEHEKGNWHWFQRLVGGAFKAHPNDPSNVQQAKIRVLDPNHPSTNMLPKKFYFTDEWYDFKEMSDRRHDLLSIDERSYQGGLHGDYHPLAWYHEFDGGRVFYTGIGHSKEAYQNELYLEHLAGGLEYALADRKPLNYANVRPDPRRFKQKVVADSLIEPVSFDLTDDYTGAMIVQREGKLLWLDVATQQLQTMAELDVFQPKKRIEFGLLAATFDPDFDNNQIIYVMYNLEDKSGKHDLLQRLSQFKVTDKKVEMDSEQVLFDIPNDNTCCHTGGNLEFDSQGNMFIALGDNANPFKSNGSGPMNNTPEGTAHDALRSAGNSQDLRGKILRITPDKQGSYSIPKGNLFASKEQGRPEIYVMGTRNPYTIAIDQQTGDLYYGDVGPDAKKDTAEFGPRGYDEINKVTKPGFYGWPIAIGNNQPYRMYDYQQQKTDKLFNPLAAKNFSPRNTGLKTLPPAQPALVWYPYAQSPRFPELGKGGRNALVAGIYPAANGEALAYPEYYQDKLFISDFMRSWIKVVTVDEYDDVIKIEDFAANVKFGGPLDLSVEKDGRLWILEYGSQWWPGEKTSSARLSYIEFDGDVELSIPEEEPEIDLSQGGGLGHEAQLLIAEGKEATVNNSCIACHKPNDKSVGPSFLQVKQKYIEREDAKDYIAQAIANGSNGKWGEHAMPAHDFIKLDEREKIAEYILSLTAENTQ